MFIVYVLKSKNEDWLYVGLTENLGKRFNAHNNGYVKSTRSRRPYKIVYKERIDNRKKARAREKYLKSGSGKEYLKEIVYP